VLGAAWVVSDWVLLRGACGHFAALCFREHRVWGGFAAAWVLGVATMFRMFRLVF
jgi:hypothetical protein